MGKQKFTHKKMSIDMDYVDIHIDKMQRDGWELISAIQSPVIKNSIMFFWKQPVSLVIRPRSKTISTEQ